jgi:hypothetical protein
MTALDLYFKFQDGYVTRLIKIARLLLPVKGTDCAMVVRRNEYGSMKANAAAAVHHQDEQSALLEHSCPVRCCRKCPCRESEGIAMLKECGADDGKVQLLFAGGIEWCSSVSERGPNDRAYQKPLEMDGLVGLQSNGFRRQAGDLSTRQ